MSAAAVDVLESPAGCTPGACAADELMTRYLAVRGRSVQQVAGLSAEDQCVQSMAEASPTKWHLAHTTWFFESIVLEPNLKGCKPFDARLAYLFNSYYESLGPRISRTYRGLLTRPSLDEVHRYRAHVDEAIALLLRSPDEQLFAKVKDLVELGLQHEQQHQELALTDILHAMSLNPLRPSIGIQQEPASVAACNRWLTQEGGDAFVGHVGPTFAFDNEGPAHAVRLQPYALANRLVTNAEFQEFIDDDGYQTPSLWLSDGWSTVRASDWKAPMYWLEDGLEFTLSGVRRRHPKHAVQHVSFFEAAAFALWSGARLPTEFEWEVAVDGSNAPSQSFGVAWQWTRSSYDPYPRYQPPRGPMGEYNGKFMVGQLVLRGSSFATSPGHERPTYRNYFPPSSRWQFTGIRLAKDL